MQKLLNKLGYYKLDQLEVGGHCGCCGQAMPKAIFVDKDWTWGLCESCAKHNDIEVLAIDITRR